MCVCVCVCGAGDNWCFIVFLLSRHLIDFYPKQ